MGKTWKIDRQSLKKLVREYDTEKWKEGLRKKSSLRIYNLEKGNIGYDFCYRNNSSSKFYARARTNTLQLEEHKGRGLKNFNTTCKLCGEEKEDLVHFIVKCKSLETKRNYNLIEKDISDPEERMRKLLYRNEKHQEIGRQIKNLWNLRRELMDKLVKDPNKNTPTSGMNVNQDRNPPHKRIDTGQMGNSSQGGLVTGQGKNHHRVVMSQGKVESHHRMRTT